MKPPFLTMEDVEAEIAAEQYYRFPDTSVTVCCLTLKNGANVVGKAACINPGNYDAVQGRASSRENARREVFPLLAYAIFESMRPKPVIPSIEPTITPENFHDIRWIDGGCDLEEAVQMLAGTS